MWLIGTLDPVPAQGGGPLEGLLYFVIGVTALAAIGWALQLIGDHRVAAPPRLRRHRVRHA